MEWIYPSLTWYFYLLILGIVMYPLTRKLFSSFVDRGYPFAKTIGILFVSYIMLILGNFKILAFTQANLFLIVFCFVIFYLYVKKRKNGEIKKPSISEIKLIIFEELLFLISLLFLTYVRGQEPSIRGLEKFMDYGFMNSILRSKFFPPLDIWLSADPSQPAGYPINYYYFGHLTGAVLIRLTGIPSSIGYNLILATIFAQGITLSFSLCSSIVYTFCKKINPSLLFGLLGSFIVNLAGNLHTIYLFTSGYSTDNPVPFWSIISGYNPSKYWYPNATRFIPFTIHEFPSYSYVVADLHGHVFDIPFVLLTIALLFLFFTERSKKQKKENRNVVFFQKIKQYVLAHLRQLFLIIFLGFMTAVHYMTNAFDGPIYMLLIGALSFFLFGFTKELFITGGIVFLSFLFFSFPFSSHFSPFVSGIGVNCSPSFLVAIEKWGPFLFEKGNCQPDPFWQLFVLWGFFWICMLLFCIAKAIILRMKTHQSEIQFNIDDFIFVLFAFSTALLLIPEFFYVKDIYPAHFRANTMFKLGYQAFIMMAIASCFTLYRISTLETRWKHVLRAVFVLFFAFIMIYPQYSFPSYYGKLMKKPELDGIAWTAQQYPEDQEIIKYLNEKEQGQPIILEAQGDSYTDFERISAYTGLPTVAGWWVHEWLWRGSSNVVGDRIPDVVALYESKDIEQTKQLLQKYQISYVVVSQMEREKYKNLNEEKFAVLGNKVFTSSNGFGALYQVKK